MAIFPFNANKPEHPSDWSTIYPDKPLACANQLMNWGDIDDIDIDIDEAFALAPIDPKVFGDLMLWAKKATDLTQQTKADLFDIFIKGKPRKGPSETQRRDTRLRFVAEILVRNYPPMKMTRTAESKTKNRKPSAASILAQVRGMPSEGTMNNVLIDIPENIA